MYFLCGLVILGVKYFVFVGFLMIMVVKFILMEYLCVKNLKMVFDIL